MKTTRHSYRTLMLALSLALPAACSSTNYSEECESEVGRNNTLEAATRTPISNVQQSALFSGRLLCPPGDIDIYRVDMPATSEIRTSVLGASVQNISIDILNSDGVPLTAIEDTSQADRTELRVRSETEQSYYIRIAGVRDLPSSSYDLSLLVALDGQPGDEDYDGETDEYYDGETDEDYGGETDEDYGGETDEDYGGETDEDYDGEQTGEY